MSFVMELKELAELYSRGAISAEEFAVSKGRVLDQAEAHATLGDPTGFGSGKVPAMSPSAPNPLGAGPGEAGRPPVRQPDSFAVPPEKPALRPDPLVQPPAHRGPEEASSTGDTVPAPLASPQPLISLNMPVQDGPGRLAALPRPSESALTNVQPGRLSSEAEVTGDRGRHAAKEILNAREAAATETAHTELTADQRSEADPSGMAPARSQALASPSAQRRMEQYTPSPPSPPSTWSPPPAQRPSGPSAHSSRKGVVIAVVCFALGLGGALMWSSRDADTERRSVTADSRSNESDPRACGNCRRSCISAQCRERTTNYGSGVEWVWVCDRGGMSCLDHCTALHGRSACAAAQRDEPRNVVHRGR